MVPLPLLDVEPNFPWRLCHPKGAAACFLLSGHASKLPFVLAYEDMRGIKLCTEFENLFFLPVELFWTRAGTCSLAPVDTAADWAEELARKARRWLINSNLPDTLEETNPTAASDRAAGKSC